MKGRLSQRASSWIARFAYRGARIAPSCATGTPPWCSTPLDVRSESDGVGEVAPSSPFFVRFSGPCRGEGLRASWTGLLYADVGSSLPPLPWYAYSRPHGTQQTVHEANPQNLPDCLVGFVSFTGQWLAQENHAVVFVPPAIPLLIFPAHLRPLYLPPEGCMHLAPDSTESLI